MYVAVKGGERAIESAHALLARERRGDTAVPELSPAQIEEQLSIAVARVMAEGSLYDPELAALAIKQARGDLIEAIFLVRAYRTTLPRIGFSLPIETGRMAIRRRVSATFKDLPGGQVLGPTFDYTHRLIDFGLNDHDSDRSGGKDGPTRAPEHGLEAQHPMPRVLELLDQDGLIEQAPPSVEGTEPGDLTRDPVDFPVSRDLRLQALARGDEGFLLALGYSTQRGYGRTHPFAGEIRMGEVTVEAFLPETGFAIPFGTVLLTECEMVNQFKGSKTEPPQFTRGYGLAFGHLERKAMAMALVDRSLRAAELDEATGAPAQDVEFVLSHCDNVQATGFVEHLKLPHYVDFQSELELVRKLRAETESATGSPTEATQITPAAAE
jgi:alpha-D-ribose 1-methylphosphonate 5-triphosphate synthase subunit PhnI